MNYILLGLLALSLCACGNKDDSKAAAEDPIYGTWIYSNPTDSTKGVGAVVSKDGAIQLISMKFFTMDSQTNTAGAYYRRNSGTYTRSGEIFEATYAYETCNPIKTEKFFAKIDPSSGKLYVANEDRSLIFNMTRSESNSSANITMIEDKDCNKM